MLLDIPNSVVCRAAACDHRPGNFQIPSRVRNEDVEIGNVDVNSGIAVVISAYPPDGEHPVRREIERSCNILHCGSGIGLDGPGCVLSACVSIQWWRCDTNDSRRFGERDDGA